MSESSEIRQRLKKDDKPKSRWEPPKHEWDPDLPYGGRVYLAREKVPDPWWVLCLEILAICFACGLAYYSYYYFDHVHYHITKGYANLGFSSAQHLMGEKYFHGRGVEKNKHIAMDYYKLAADQGHPHSSYNLAVGHLQGIRKDLLESGDPHKLIRHAAANGVPEAIEVLDDLCARGHCED